MNRMYDKMHCYLYSTYDLFCRYLNITYCVMYFVLIDYYFNKLNSLTVFAVTITFIRLLIVIYFVFNIFFPVFVKTCGICKSNKCI